MMKIEKFKKLKIKERIIEELNKDHIGSEAVEGILLVPIIIATFIMLLYFFFMILTYINYGNIANSIAMELNMRQTGYSTAMRNYTTAPKILTYRNAITKNSKVATDGSLPSSYYLPASEIEVSPYTKELKCGTYFALSKYKSHFTMPYTQLTHIKVSTSKAITTSLKKQMAGTVITVEITYAPLVLFNGGDSLVKLTSTGYNVIS